MSSGNLERASEHTPGPHQRADWPALKTPPPQLRRHHPRDLFTLPHRPGRRLPLARQHALRAILQADGGLGRLLGRRFPSADTLRHFLYTCHDDRLIAEAKRFRAQGVGIEISPDLIHEANQDAEQAGVAHLVRFVEGDFLIADISRATVVTLCLLPEVNRQLLPKLLADLKPGTRIVSYTYDLGDWAPEKTVPVSRGTVYYWVVPPRAKQRD